MAASKARQVPALKVKQWLSDWNKVDFNAEEHRAKPEEQFYLFSLPARELRTLSGIVRREAKNAAPRTDDLGIQRQHDKERSEEINRFVEFGYPWSTLSEAKRESEEFNDLRKPGWLPTAVVINILPKGSTRNGSAIKEADLARIAGEGAVATLQLPYEKWSADWSPSGLPPFEVIDGQHRLWAFDENSKLETFDLPVVAFVDLDISWQAYLFWTINIKPKRINPSLAYDLYPLLRSENWLDRAEGHAVYRETRAQELTEILWSQTESPWFDRINMLGERSNPWATQSGWIKTLIASFIRPWDGRTNSTGGLFGGRSKKSNEVLGWSRAQQAAFLIFVWQSLQSAVAGKKDGWALDLRSSANATAGSNANDDLAFYGPFSLIKTDQGVRGYLQVVNDICYRRAANLKLNKWLPDDQGSANPISAVSTALASLKTQHFAPFVASIGEKLATFDWRTSAAPNLEELERRSKLVFRGSGGYKELRTQLLENLSMGTDDLSVAAQRLLDAA